MKKALVALAIVGVCAPTAVAQEERQKVDPVARLCEEFTGFDHNEDGTVELEELVPVPSEAKPKSDDSPLVLVLIEARLLEEFPTGPEGTPEAPELRPALLRYTQDLAQDGWQPRLIAAKVYSGERHQDGRTVLALRRFFQAVREEVPSLAGAVLVGSFPEAFLVRSYNWRKQTKLVLNEGTPREKRFEEPVDYLRTVPEPVATRCELVLCTTIVRKLRFLRRFPGSLCPSSLPISDCAFQISENACRLIRNPDSEIRNWRGLLVAAGPRWDLDGNWERLYVEKREHLPTVIGVFPGGVPPRGGVCTDFERGGVVFEDFFYVNDGRLDVREALGAGAEGSEGEEVRALDFEPLDEYENAECAPGDLTLGNPLARPDLFVSRLNARNIALQPRSDIKGTEGEGLLDTEGRPQKVVFAEEASVPHWMRLWERDPILERRLLVEYFERNHLYRAGAFAEAFKPAAIGHKLGNGFGRVKRASPAWTDFEEEGYNAGEEASLLDMVHWLQRPAVLRDFRAHSDPWGSTFGKCDITALEEACGGRPWSWSKEDTALMPSLASSNGGGKADFALFRTLWENEKQAKEACFYFHTGCHSISPAHAENRPYQHPEYGYWQGAEAMLFYGRGLALIGRAKVFYEEPRGFYEALAKGKTFGEAWGEYFRIESSATDLKEVGGGIGRKRAYFWSVIGDWTLRLQAP